MGYQGGGSKFKIKSAGAEADGAGSGLGSDAVTWLLLIVAGLIVAGGSMGRLVINNPA